MGEFGGLFAVEDDSNSAWEDVEYEPENAYEFEQMWRADELRNNETVGEFD